MPKQTPEHPDLIELCTNCTRIDCDGTPCSDYRAIQRRINAPQSRSRYHASEPDPDPSQLAACGVDTLQRVNKAITALENLLADPKADPFLTGRGTANKLLEQMKRSRFNRCQHLIDWNIVVNNAKETTAND